VNELNDDDDEFCIVSELPYSVSGRY